MDFIDHLIFTTNTDNVRDQYPPLLSDYAGKPVSTSPPDVLGLPGRDSDPVVLPMALPVISDTGSFDAATRANYIFYEDPSVIDKAIQRHWFDMTRGPINLLTADGTPAFEGSDAPPYHLIYAYMIENTRIAQIIGRLIHLFQHDEVLGVASATDRMQQQAAQWISNTESLFYKTLSNTSYRNIAGDLRFGPEGGRRNAYQRMFGMELAFGDPSNAEFPYYKAKTANREFVLLFEQLLAELWQAYINANNTSGANTTDYQRIIDMATKIRQILLARRGGNGTLTLQNYRYMNLSRQEYASVGFMTWLMYIVSTDSPLVNFLGCQANTASERLDNIGKKVGLEAHKKSQALFDMAAPMATILRNIEFGTFEVTAPSVWIRNVIESQRGLPGVTPDPAERDALLDILTVINNWEKATGHKIKNPEANITGTVRVQSNGARVNSALN